MKIIFLDIDGVLNNFQVCERQRKYIEDPMCEIDPVRVLMVKHLCEETGARIVISSSWQQLGFDVLKDEFGMGPYLECVTGVPAYDEEDRAATIKMFVVANKPETWVAFDDFELEGLGKNFIKTESFHSKRGGLFPEHINRAKEILNGSN